MTPSSERVDPARFWDRVRTEFRQVYLDFREERPSAAAPSLRRREPAPPSVVGTWAGRLWEVGFRAPRALSPDLQIGITTATRLVDPARMTSEWLPWLYVGERPRVFSKNVFDFDRIIMRYRRREGNFRGTLTGDDELDRRWGVYPYQDELGEVFREEDVRDVLRLSAGLSPDPRRLIPTYAVFGTEATLTLLVDPRTENVAKVPKAFEGFARVLDRIEERTGQPPARTRPIAMDLLRDESGVPFPVPKFDCPVCGSPTHPRYQANLETEVCEKCGKMLYRWS